MGAGVVVSQFLGAKDHREAQEAVHTSLAIAVIMGLLLTVGGTPDNWIMTVESNNEALIELSKIYDIVWRQCPCLKGIMNTNVTPELERLACEQMKG